MSLFSMFPFSFKFSIVREARCQSDYTPLYLCLCVTHSNATSSNQSNPGLSTSELSMDVIEETKDFVCTVMFGHVNANANVEMAE